MILVATTTAAYRMADDVDYWSAWLRNARNIKASVAEEVRYFAALETDARGLVPFAPLIEAVDDLGGTYWTFSVDDGSHVIGTDNRLLRITMGQNLCSSYAMQEGADWMLFLASDCAAPPDALPRLLELDWPVCALNVDTYCLDGNPSGLLKNARRNYPDWDVRDHMASAACLFLKREVFTRVRWRVDKDSGMTDDPCYHADCLALGWETRVRHDVVAEHYPKAVGPIETRHADRLIRR